MKPLEQLLADEGYICVRQLPSGEYIGVLRFLYTYGLCVGLDRTGMRGRYCYENPAHAAIDAVFWNGQGDPPGEWIKYKGAGGERCKPQRFQGIPIVVEARP